MLQMLMTLIYLWQVLRIRHSIHWGPLLAPHMPNVVQIWRFHSSLYQQLYACHNLHRYECSSVGQSCDGSIEFDCSRRLPSSSWPLLSPRWCQEPGVHWQQDSRWTRYCADDCVVWKRSVRRFFRRSKFVEGFRISEQVDASRLNLYCTAWTRYSSLFIPF